MNRRDYEAHVALGETIAAANAMRAGRAADDLQVQAMHAFRRRQEQRRRDRGFLLRIVGLEVALCAVLSFVR